MAKERTSKELAQRIDPTYFRRAHPLRRARYRLSVLCAALGAVWLGFAALAGHDGLYAPGPVDQAHALLEADCAQCHVERFRAVQDANCLPCHVVDAHSLSAVRREPACARCHAEHRGRDGLRAVGDESCAGCHEDHKGIRTFDEHVGVRPKPFDQNLRFSHAGHLKHDLKNGPLSCRDCHTKTGPGFAPIAFDWHCARCHAERLEPGSDQVVPHGLEPGELREWIALAYMKEMGVVEREEALPGRGREPPPWRDALLKKAENALGGLFRPGGGCLTCHIRDGDDLKPVVFPWGGWMPKARFNHARHRSVACVSCHDVLHNDNADTLTLPTLSSCRECHHEAGARTSCTTCHVYHRRR